MSQILNEIRTTTMNHSIINSLDLEQDVIHVLSFELLKSTANLEPSKK
jgi:hypothetical protein